VSSRGVYAQWSPQILPDRPKGPPKVTVKSEPSTLSTESMIGMEPIQEILETAFHSGYLSHAIPISIMLIGPSGAGKSKSVMQYKTSAGCHVTTDVTSMGLQQLLQGDHKGEIKYIIIPDFNLVLSHRHSTLQLTIGNLLSMTSEGIVRIDDGRDIKEMKHEPIGIISAMTRDMYSSIGKKWVALGFNRRFLPVNYDYSLRTREFINNSISLGETTSLHLPDKKISIPGKKIDIGIGEEDSQRLKVFSGELAECIGWVGVRSRQNGHSEAKPRAVFTGRQLEFSPHIILRTLARAHALRDGRGVVNSDDVEFIMKMISFTRFDHPVML
jgi:hypothetical protein